MVMKKLLLILLIFFTVACDYSNVSEEAKNEYINFISEMNTFFRILFVLVTFGETACIMEDNQIDFCKFIDDNIDDLSDEQKNICNYAKLFCSNSYINDLHSNIKHLHFCSYFNEIGQKRKEIQKQIDNLKK